MSKILITEHTGLNLQSVSEILDFPPSFNNTKNILIESAWFMYLNKSPNFILGVNTIAGPVIQLSDLYTHKQFANNLVVCFVTHTFNTL